MNGREIINHPQPPANKKKKRKRKLPKLPVTSVVAGGHSVTFSGPEAVLAGPHGRPARCMELGFTSLATFASLYLWGFGGGKLLWGLLSRKLPKAASSSLSSADTLFLASPLQKEPGSDCSAWQGPLDSPPSPSPLCLFQEAFLGCCACRGWSEYSCRTQADPMAQKQRADL